MVQRVVVTTLALLSCVSSAAKAEIPHRTTRAAGPAHVEEASRWKSDGLALGREGRSRDAIAKLEQSIALEPDDWEAHLLLGFAYRDAGDMAASVPHLERARVLNPEVHGLVGVVYKDLGRYDEAENALRAALRLGPDDALLLGHLGDLGLRRRDYATCVDGYARYLAAMDSRDPSRFSERDKARYRNARDGLLVCQSGRAEPVVAPRDPNAPRVEVSCVDGQPEGMFEIRDPNGVLLTRDTFRNGRKEGTWEFWDSAGAQIVKLEYRNGRKHGPCTMFYSALSGDPRDGGQLKLDMAFVDDQVDGAKTSYYPGRPLGTLRSEARVARGRVLSARYWTPEGREVSTAESMAQSSRDLELDHRYREELDQLVQAESASREVLR